MRNPATGSSRESRRPLWALRRHHVKHRGGYLTRRIDRRVDRDVDLEIPRSTLRDEVHRDSDRLSDNAGGRVIERDDRGIVHEDVPGAPVTNSAAEDVTVERRVRATGGVLG